MTTLAEFLPNICNNTALPDQLGGVLPIRGRCLRAKSTGQCAWVHWPGRG